MKNTVTQEQINNLIADSDIKVSTVFDKVTVVSLKLPSGFVVTESSACVDPANYDESLGRELCLQRIENKLWELEGYVLATELNKQKNNTVLNEYKNSLDLEISGENSVGRKAYIEKLISKGAVEEKERYICEGYYKGLRVAREMLEKSHP